MVTRCYSKPDLRDLLAPYICDEQQTPVEQMSTTETPVEPMSTTETRKLDVVCRDTTNASANQRNIDIKKTSNNK